MASFIGADKAENPKFRIIIYGFSIDDERGLFSYENWLGKEIKERNGWAAILNILKYCNKNYFTNKL